MEKWYDIIGSSIEMRLRDSVDPEKSRWIRGQVVAGYRYQDGIITMNRMMEEQYGAVSNLMIIENLKIL